MKKIIKATSLISGLLCLIILAVSVSFIQFLPESFYVGAGQELELNSQINKFISAERQDDLSVPADAAVTPKSYTANLKLLGVVPIKSVEVKMQERQCVIPCGTPFGIKLYTAGVIVVGMTDVDTSGGAVNPARLAGIKEGDAIISIAGQKVSTTEDVAKAFEDCDGRAIDVEIQRADSSFVIKFTPALSASQKRYKAGLWVRDSSAGIGTMTFYDPATHVFAGLGHAVCDVDTGEILPLMSGAIVKSTITGCNASRNGSPGELCGYFHNDTPLGEVMINGETGVYGKTNRPLSNAQALPVAMKQEISEGKAQIIASVNDEGEKYYDIEIVKINYSSSLSQKNMVIKITDPVLLEETGGIVQGMSGSPIIQNGMLVGAVTHVFVNNSTHGYGIFAENMLNTANSLQQSLINPAA